MTNPNSETALLQT